MNQVQPHNEIDVFLKLPLNLLLSLFVFNYLLMDLIVIQSFLFSHIIPCCENLKTILWEQKEPTDFVYEVDHVTEVNT